MEPTSAVSTASAQVKNLSSIVAADPTIPVSHKNVLQTIFSFLLNLAPFVLQVFLGEDGQIADGLAAPLPALSAVASETTSGIASHPISESLSKALQTASAGATDQSRGVLDKIFAFVLKILPVVLGLFSHGSPASAPAVASAAGAGNGSTTGSGQTSGAGADAGGVPLAGAGDGQSGATVAASN
jgi:hypothetical protein